MYYDVKATYLTDNVKSNSEHQLIILLDDLLAKADYLATKRLIEVIFSFILILLCGPLFLIVAILIKIESRGPVIFKQKRVGINGQEFIIYKFRSMKINSTGVIIGCDGTLTKLKNDWRITKIGSIIRKTSIDELPQLFNVFKGNMSLIGPRPLIRQMVEPYPYISKVRGLVKPGITGLWQVSSRENNTSVLDMIDLDLHYIKNCCLSMDFAILIKTFRVVLSSKGAM